MFTIVISEKGGSERRESFDKAEVNVGRVQGNDLMLPKGNVSKHHARLLFRDGRFIVTDLKSTNGTYVNGRKIAQATIVREGDKIYVGDFVLRLEAPAGASLEGFGAADEGAVPMAGGPPPLAPPDAPPPAPFGPSAGAHAPPVGAYAPPQQASPMQGHTAPPPFAAPIAPMAPEPPAPAPASPAPSAPMPPVTGGTGPARRLATQLGTGPGGPRPTQLTTEDEGPPQLPFRPSGAPRPGGPSTQAPPPVREVAREPSREAPREPVRPVVASPAPSLVRAPASVPPTALSQAPLVPVAVPASVRSVRVGMTREAPAAAGRRLGLVTLVGRVLASIDAAALDSAVVPDAVVQQVTRAAKEQSQAMRSAGEAPEGVDLDVLLQDAVDELTGFGSLNRWLDDESVSEIHCLRFDQVIGVRAGATLVAETSFSSDEALRRVIGRLAAYSGLPWQPGELALERTLADGTTLSALTPPASPWHVLSLRRRNRVEAELESCVGDGMLSKAMASFLEACVRARASLLVVGSAPHQVLGALAGLAGPGQRVCVLQDAEDVVVPRAHHISLAVPPGQARQVVRAAARMGPHHFVVTRLQGGLAAPVLEAMVEGTEGVLASLLAPTLRHGLSRLVAQLVLTQPGLALDAARELVGESFDLALEVGVGPDGKARVLRVAELTGSDAKGVVARDVFVWASDGGAGSFNPTGVVPRIATELQARGTKLDPQTFKRASK